MEKIKRKLIYLRRIRNTRQILQKMMRTLIMLLLFLIINVILAQEVFKFFEFAPRSTDYFYLNNQTVIQPFLPFNDYLSIVGIWFGNNELTSIRLKLIDQNDNILVDKEVNIPTIQGGWYGEEYQIPLDENFRINSGQEHKLIIEGLATSSLKIFTKNILEILQGSENYLYFPETLKPYSLNNEITNYTLKLSLYEGKESAPPVITNLKVNILSPASVNITFNSNEPIMYKLDLRNLSNNSTSTYGINYFENCPPNIKICQINLETIPDSHYQFSLTANDFWNNTSTLSGEFITPKEAASTPTTTINTSSSQILDKSEQKTTNQDESQTQIKLSSSSIQNENLTFLNQSSQYQLSSQTVLNLGISREIKSKFYSTSMVSKPQKFLSTSTSQSVYTLMATKTSLESPFSIVKFLLKQKIKIFLIIIVVILFIGGLIVYKKNLKK